MGAPDLEHVVDRGSAHDVVGYHAPDLCRLPASPQWYLTTQRKKMVFGSDGGAVDGRHAGVSRYCARPY